MWRPYGGHSAGLHLAPSRELVQELDGGTWAYEEQRPAVTLTPPLLPTICLVFPGCSSDAGVPWDQLLSLIRAMVQGASWTNQLSFLNQNVEDECAFSKGELEHIERVRRSCPVRIVSKSP